MSLDRPPGATQVQETCSQNLQGDLLALERRSCEEFAPKAALNQVGRSRH